MFMNGDGPRPSWIRGHARRHQRTGELDARWMPGCQCGWAFYASVRSLRIADRGLREGILMNMMREDQVWRRGPR